MEINATGTPEVGPWAGSSTTPPPADRRRDHGLALPPASQIQYGVAGWEQR